MGAKFTVHVGNTGYGSIVSINESRAIALCTDMGVMGVYARVIDVAMDGSITMVDELIIRSIGSYNPVIAAFGESKAIASYVDSATNQNCLASLINLL
jgi:hypothetical protein